MLFPRKGEQSLQSRQLNNHVICALARTTREVYPKPESPMCLVNNATNILNLDSNSSQSLPGRRDEVSLLGETCWWPYHCKPQITT